MTSLRLQTTCTLVRGSPQRRVRQVLHWQPDMGMLDKGAVKLIHTSTPALPLRRKDNVLRSLGRQSIQPSMNQRQPADSVEVIPIMWYWSWPFVTRRKDFGRIPASPSTWPWPSQTGHLRRVRGFAYHCEQTIER